MNGSWRTYRPAFPHRLLNTYIEGVAGFIPLDGMRTILGGEEDVGPVEVITLRQYDGLGEASYCLFFVHVFLQGSSQ